MNNSVKKTAYTIIVWQLMLLLGLALIMFLFKGIQDGLSALWGGLAYWLPTFFFVWRVFAKTTARAAKQFLIKFISGEFIKLFVSGALFLFVVSYLPVNVISVLIGFVGAVVAFWVASIFLFTTPREGATCQL